MPGSDVATAVCNINMPQACYISAQKAPLQHASANDSARACSHLLLPTNALCQSPGQKLPCSCPLYRTTTAITADTVQTSILHCLPAISCPGLPLAALPRPAALVPEGPAKALLLCRARYCRFRSVSSITCKQYDTSLIIGCVKCHWQSETWQTPDSQQHTPVQRQ